MQAILAPCTPRIHPWTADLLHHLSCWMQPAPLPPCSNSSSRAYRTSWHSACGCCHLDQRVTPCGVTSCTHCLWTATSSSIHLCSRPRLYACTLSHRWRCQAACRWCFIDRCQARTVLGQRVTMRRINTVWCLTCVTAVYSVHATDDGGYVDAHRLRAHSECICS